MASGHSTQTWRYSRDETEAQKLDRNWSELVQELRVIGIGVQILFAFLLGIAFQARFAKTSPFQRDIYLTTLVLSGLATALLIAPAAMHRFLFHIGVKDELVTFTNWFAVAGLAVLSFSMTGAIVLTADWVSGTEAATICGVGGALVFSLVWFVFPIWLRRRHDDSGTPASVSQLNDDGSLGPEPARQGR